MTSVSWGVLLGEMIIRRARLTELNSALWQPSIPGDRATQRDLDDAQVRLGRALDAQHRDLLLEGNGWSDGFGWGDLLSTREIAGNTSWKRAIEFLGDVYAAGGSDLPPPAGLCPVLVGDEDLVAIDLDGGVTDGGHPVYRFDHAEVLDQWPNMRQYWLAELTNMNWLIERELRRAEAGENRYP